MIDRIDDDIRGGSGAAGSGASGSGAAGSGAATASGDVIFVEKPYYLPERPTDSGDCSGDGWDDEDNGSGSGKESVRMVDEGG